MVKNMRKKQIVALFLILVFISVFTINVFAASTQIELSKKSCTAGEEVFVDLTMAENTGVISMQLELEFNEQFTLMEVIDGGILGTCNHSDIFKSSYILSWENDLLTENVANTGKLVSLKFKANEDVALGEYAVRVVRAEVLDTDISEVECTVTNGSITVAKKESGGGGGGGGATVKPPVKEDKEEETPEPAKPENDQKPATTITFSDVKENDWFFDYVSELAEKGIVSGDGNGGFAPNNKVTREQFLKMLLGATNIEAEECENTFADVADDWYTEYVLKAKTLGIVNGVTDTKFGIGENITRQDMAVMITRTIEKMGISIESTDVDAFADGHTVSDYATEAVEYMKSIGLIEGYNNEYRPHDNLTRAEATKVIAELMNLTK